jgi:hypothetical protein
VAGRAGAAKQMPGIERRDRRRCGHWGVCRQWANSKRLLAAEYRAGQATVLVPGTASGLKLRAAYRVAHFCKARGHGARGAWTRIDTQRAVGIEAIVTACAHGVCIAAALIQHNPIQLWASWKQSGLHYLAQVVSLLKRNDPGSKSGRRTDGLQACHPVRLPSGEASLQSVQLIAVCPMVPFYLCFHMFVVR